MEKQKPLDKRLIAVIVGLVLVIMALVFFLLFRRESTTISDNDTPRMGYASEATVVLDQDSLQAAMDEAMKNASEKNVALWYKNTAISDNGVDFDCFVGNSSGNMFDAFLAIYADAEMTDQLFLSDLLRPGSAFEKISLDRALEPGMNTVYVAVTLVDTEEDGSQTIKSQVVHTMDFSVSE